jgi:hypothetical protein
MFVFCDGMLLIEGPFQFSFVYTHTVKGKQTSFLGTSFEGVCIGNYTRLQPNSPFKRRLCTFIVL